MKLDYPLVCLLYIACLFTGALYFFGIATILGVAAGFGPLGLLFLFLPLVLAGFVSGLSLFQPRVGACLAICLVLPFIAAAGYSAIYNIPASEPTFWVIPGCVVIFIATLNLLFTRQSLWEGSRSLRIVAGILATLPALAGIWLLGSIALWMVSWEWKL
ncbi:MAG TPA: hypothetical protein VMZ26_03000 [Pyrinomonadaceae bacterium]|nr:hypothetical protein [Pyrinomonadaceae bacterium]